MKKLIVYEQNGGEYIGTIQITCDSFEMKSSTQVIVNGALIQLDEKIDRIEDLE